MKDVDRQIKEINGKLFDRAFSDDPAVACQGIGKLVTHLMITMDIAETHEYDEMLRYQNLGANQAWYEYTEEKNPGKAMQTVRAVLSKVGKFAHDKRFTILVSDAFVGRQP